MNDTPLNAALALVAFGPARGNARPQDWINVASPMCKYCRECEDVNLAAARIIADYVTALESVCDSEQLARAQSALANAMMSQPASNAKPEAGPREK